MMIASLVRRLPLCLAILLAAAATAQIQPGNLVVLRLGDGAAPLVSGAAAPVFLDEYTPAGTLVQSIALPTAANGTNHAFGISSSATSEGHLNLSPDGRFLTCAGYDALPGTLSIAATASSATSRVVARVDLAGNVDTSTATNSAFSGSNIRSAVTDDGLQFWMVGANSGVQYATLGASTSTAVSTGSPTNMRTIGIAAGQLYVSSASSTFQGMSAVGIGLPTNAGNTVMLLPGFPMTTGPSSYDFFFADANTVYVADDHTNGNGGVEKWTFSGGLWTLQYVMAPNATTGCRGLSGEVNAGVVTLYATTTAGELAMAIDNGPGSPMVSLLGAAPNTVLRGVRLVRLRGVVTHAGSGSPTTVGVPTIGTSGDPVLGNLTFQVAAGNLVPAGLGFTLLGVGNLNAGVPLPGAPASAHVYLNNIAASFLLIADGQGGAAVNMPIPSLSHLVGVQLTAQVLALDFVMPEPLPIGCSDGMRMVIGN